MIFQSAFARKNMKRFIRAIVCWLWWNIVGKRLLEDGACLPNHSRQPMHFWFELNFVLVGTNFLKHLLPEEENKLDVRNCLVLADRRERRTQTYTYHIREAALSLLILMPKHNHVDGIVMPTVWMCDSTYTSNFVRLNSSGKGLEEVHCVYWALARIQLPE